MKQKIQIIFFLAVNNIIAQDIIIKDSLLNIGVENVTLLQNNTGLVSDEMGKINIDTFNFKDTIIISHLIYHSKKLLKKDVKKTILLQPKINILPTVVLYDNAKIPLPEKYPVFKIKTNKKLLQNTTVGDLLSNNSSIVIQESQSGGGSPNYRGMEANRLLLVVDGLPLNNAIYRSGHVQSSSTINPAFIKSVSLLSGPASVAYGNGAMGGALLFKTKENNIDKDKIEFNQQYESSSNTIITNFLSFYSHKKSHHFTGFGIKKAGNIKMGKNRMHGYKNWGNESIVTNGSEQLFTGHEQFDLIHKSTYKLKKNKTLRFNSQYSTSSNTNRFDKLNDYEGSLTKYTYWYYGPQKRLLQSIAFNEIKKTILFNHYKIKLAFQNTQESRHKQKSSETLLNNRHENVKIYDLMVDFNKNILNSKFAYGMGSRLQNINSHANLTDRDGGSFYNTTRYPDGGSVVEDYYAYSNIFMSFKKNLSLVIGARWNKNNLTANFLDTTTILLPFSEIKNKNSSFVKSILFSYQPLNTITLNCSYYNGFRNPNLDDVGKVFSKNDNYVIVPNDKLQPEYSENIEFNINYQTSKFNLETQIFSTKLTNAIKREFGELNNEDSLIYDGQKMRIQQNQNIQSASIRGVSIYSRYKISKSLSILVSHNLLVGLTNDNRPLAHIPPSNGAIKINYSRYSNMFSLYSNYNGQKKSEDYDDEGVDNLDEATENGNPMWYTLNFIYKKTIDKNLSLGVGVKNIADVHYKTFGSGISASGRNFIVSLQANF